MVHLGLPRSLQEEGAGVRSEPTSSEKEFYDDNGFLSVPEFLGERELDRWR